VLGIKKHARASEKITNERERKRNLLGIYNFISYLDTKIKGNSNCLKTYRNLFKCQCGVYFT